MKPWFVLQYRGTGLNMYEGQPANPQHSMLTSS